nr:hypothetical protein CFP56_23988 [Quercus suber]
MGVGIEVELAEVEIRGSWKEANNAQQKSDWGWSEWKCLRETRSRECVSEVKALDQRKRKKNGQERKILGLGGGIHREAARRKHGPLTPPPGAGT